MSMTGEAMLETPTAGRLWAARLVWFLHVAAVAFFVIGWALPWPGALAFTVALSAATQIGWWICNDRCVLSVLEERLRGTLAPRLVVPEDQEQPPNFVADLGARLLGRPIPYTWTNRVIYVVVWGGGAVAALRLAFGAHA